MRKSHGIFLAALSTLSVVLLSSEEVCAQFQWLPRFVSVQTPMEVHHHYLSNVPGSSYDSSNDGMMLLRFGYDSTGTYSHPNYLRNKDSVSIEFYSSKQDSVSETKSTLIYFVLDSANNKVRNFSIEYVHQINPVGSVNGHYEYFKSSVLFSFLDYQRSGDSSFIVNFSGAPCRTKLDSAYFSSYIDDVSESNLHITKSHQIDSLLEATSLYKCSFAFNLTKLVDAVSQSNATPQGLIITTSIPDHEIHISFPSSDHPQTLFIYDVLGREVARVEISSGMMKYRIRSSQFRNGDYFVRLGKSSGSFEVY